MGQLKSKLDLKMEALGNLECAVLDEEGLNETFDFTFEWTAQHMPFVANRYIVGCRVSKPV
jgi:hypothetical protein